MLSNNNNDKISNVKGKREKERVREKEKKTTR